ncbi:MAG TPA: molybdopterin-synthase adenylyltransferase MoeB [Steroidobacteraceae bacterium]|jgi:adenylyltransferase/sulfurtransferase|nr:molybdopterin-synthase adenylyltransferase MoeB [Steroidobacteraceae bacterium]
MALPPSDLKRYARHLALNQFGPAGQQKLSASRVLIAGCGGLGSPAALYLAAAGVGTLGLLDFDVVDESNLQRQVLFETADIGEPKVERARRRLSALNPRIDVVAHQQELCAANVRELFDHYDLIIDGSDRVGTHYLVSDACVLYRKPLVTAAVYRFEGQIMSYLPDRGPCYRCLFPTIDPAAAPGCADTGVLGVLPGVMGTLQATEAIKLLTGIGLPLLGRLLTYDALELRFHELRFARREDCAVCGRQPTIVAPVDPPGFCTQRELRAVRSIDAASLARDLRAGDDAPMLIDVREGAEFEAGHLAGSINLPLSLLDHEGRDAQLQRLDTQRALVFVCRSGVRSAQAAAIAQRSGFGIVRQLDGGLLSWREEVDASLVIA